MHRIWQRAGVLPSAILKLNEGERAFVFASEVVQVEWDSKHPPMRV